MRAHEEQTIRLRRGIPLAIQAAGNKQAAACSSQLAGLNTGVHAHSQTTIPVTTSSQAGFASKYQRYRARPYAARQPAQFWRTIAGQRHGGSHRIGQQQKRSGALLETYQSGYGFRRQRGCRSTWQCGSMVCYQAAPFEQDCGSQCRQFMVRAIRFQKEWPQPARFDHLSASATAVHHSGPVFARPAGLHFLPR